MCLVFVPNAHLPLHMLGFNADIQILFGTVYTVCILYSQMYIYPGICTIRDRLGFNGRYSDSFWDSVLSVYFILKCVVFLHTVASFIYFRFYRLVNSEHYSSSGNLVFISAILHCDTIVVLFTPTRNHFSIPHSFCIFLMENLFTFL